ncbi:hypothetical protein E2P81_ATG08836 [Venturia nashicola]|nr:hypothetical protein E2P81_ATG08836 [Venturia nashicola]
MHTSNNMTPPSAKLCFELLELIFRQVHPQDQLQVNRTLTIQVCTSSPVDLYNATLVNKTWHSVAQSVIDKNIRLAIGSAKPGRFQKFVSRVRTDEDFRSRIRHLHVREWYQSGYLPSAKAPPARRTAGNLLHCPGYVVLDGFAYKRGRESSWKQMETLATTLALLQLCSFSWSAEPRIPNILLEALSAIPNCKVDIGFHQLARHVIMLPGIQTSSTLVSLHKAESSLRRLAVMVDAEDEKAVNQLGRVLTASRGLDTLQIRAYGQFDYCNEDATHLTNTHFTCATFVVRGSPYMSGLRSLSLRMDDEKSPSWGTMCATPHNMDTVRSSLYGFDGLEELELRNATHVIDADLLAHLGKTIRRLLTRQLQPWDPITQYAQSVYLSDQILTTMGTVCPLLSDLTLDMPNDATDKVSPSSAIFLAP